LNRSTAEQTTSRLIIEISGSSTSNVILSEFV
jgi:hypothetical protein